MKKVKKIIIALLLCMSVLHQDVCKINTVDASMNASYLDRYTKHVDIVCGNYGHVRVNVNLIHNMTTGKISVESIDYTKYLNAGYCFVGISDCRCKPDVGEVVKDSKITVYVTCYRIGMIGEIEKGVIYL